MAGWLAGWEGETCMWWRHAWIHSGLISQLFLVTSDHPNEKKMNTLSNSWLFSLINLVTWFPYYLRFFWWKWILSVLIIIKRDKSVTGKEPNKGKLLLNRPSVVWHSLPVCLRSKAPLHHETPTPRHLTYLMPPLFLTLSPCDIHSSSSTPPSIRHSHTILHHYRDTKRIISFHD